MMVTDQPRSMSARPSWHGGCTSPRVPIAVITAVRGLTSSEAIVVRMQRAVREPTEGRRGARRCARTGESPRWATGAGGRGEGSGSAVTARNGGRGRATRGRVCDSVRGGANGGANVSRETVETTSGAVGAARFALGAPRGDPASWASRGGWGPRGRVLSSRSAGGRRGSGEGAGGSLPLTRPCPSPPSPCTLFPPPPRAPAALPGPRAPSAPPLLPVPLPPHPPPRAPAALPGPLPRAPHPRAAPRIFSAIRSLRPGRDVCIASIVFL